MGGNVIYNTYGIVEFEVRRLAGKTNKNGLLELFRFLCAVWVAYFHGFFPVLSDQFNGVNTAVGFFFVLSGYFFLKSMEKYRERPLGEGIVFIFWGRTKRFIVPLIIAALSILYCNIAFPWELNGFNWPFSFLWFFAAQFVFLSLFFLVYRKTKRQLVFNLFCVVVICISMSAFRVLTKEFDRVARGPAMVAIGMLLSQVPKLEIRGRDGRRMEKWTVFINAVGFVAAAALYIYLAYLPGYEIWKLHLLGGFAGPAVLYFATALPVHSKILDFLGEFSVFIYLAQCPILLHHYYVSRDTREQFPLLCICAVLLFALNRILNKKKVVEKITAKK